MVWKEASEIPLIIALNTEVEKGLMPTKMERMRGLQLIPIEGKELRNQSPLGMHFKKLKILINCEFKFK